MPPRPALEHARDTIERKLAASEDWRALKQLEAREAAGEWFDVIESDVLRARLTATLSAAPEFMAWQFVDAALVCLDANQRAAALAHNNEAHTAGNANLTADGTTSPRAAAAIVSTPLIPVPDLPTQRPEAPLPPPIALKPVGDLATRIPTLQAHEQRITARRLATHIAADTAHAALARSLADAVHSAEIEGAGEARLETQQVMELDTSGDRRADPADAADAAEADDTAEAADDAVERFLPTTRRIEEAEVRIIVRQPKAPLLTTRLPPLPLTERTRSPGARLPRANRAAALKWAEPAGPEETDFRPVGSALAEAQVAIIDTSKQTEAQSRAERRSLGVAPDREQHMRRFLRALAGD